MGSGRMSGPVKVLVGVIAIALLLGVGFGIGQVLLGAGIGSGGQTAAVSPTASAATAVTSSPRAATPAATPAETASPTPAATAAPTPAPRSAPTLAPTPAPTSAPTLAPTSAPSVPGLARFVEVPVVACDTSYGADETPAPVPSTETVRLTPDLVDRVAIYATNGERVLAPAGGICTANVGVDGGAVLTVRDPQHANASVQLHTEPVCYGCALDIACSLFADAAKRQQDDFGLACDAPPQREEVSRLDATEVLFLDPARVKGTGDGSGGPNPATGAVWYAVDNNSPAASKITCVLDPGLANVCQGVVAYWSGALTPAP